MKLTTAELRRLLALARKLDAGSLSAAEEHAYRDLVRREGWSKYADSDDAKVLSNIGYGIVMAYVYVDGVDLKAEA